MSRRKIGFASAPGVARRLIDAAEVQSDGDPWLSVCVCV
jgi:hypothetical protein